MSWKCDTTMKIDEVGSTVFSIYPMFPGDWQSGNIAPFGSRYDFMKFRGKLLNSKIKIMTFVMINFLNPGVIYCASRFADGKRSTRAVVQFDEYIDNGYVGQSRLTFVNFAVFRYNTNASLPFDRARIPISGLPVIVTINASLLINN